MACGCCNNESEENYGYVGSGLKWAVNMTCEGFSMDDDDWKIIVTRGKNTVEYTKANSIKDEAEDQWYISVDTLALGAGQCYITFVAYVPDDDFPSGIRTEIQEYELVNVRQPKTPADLTYHPGEETQG